MRLHCLSHGALPVCPQRSPHPRGVGLVLLQHLVPKVQLLRINVVLVKVRRPAAGREGIVSSVWVVLMNGTHGVVSHAEHIIQRGAAFPVLSSLFFHFSSPFSYPFPSNSLPFFSFPYPGAPSLPFLFLCFPCTPLRTPPHLSVMTVCTQLLSPFSTSFLSISRCWWASTLALTVTADRQFLRAGARAKPLHANHGKAIGIWSGSVTATASA